MFSTVKLEDGIKDSCYEDFVTFAEKCLWESLLEKVTLYVESRFFGKKYISTKYDFLEIYKIFSVTNSTNLGC